MIKRLVKFGGASATEAVVKLWRVSLRGLA